MDICRPWHVTSRPCRLLMSLQLKVRFFFERRRKRKSRKKTSKNIPFSLLCSLNSWNTGHNPSLKEVSDVLLCVTSVTIGLIDYLALMRRLAEQSKSPQTIQPPSPQPILLPNNIPQACLYTQTEMIDVAKALECCHLGNDTLHPSRVSPMPPLPVTHFPQSYQHQQPSSCDHSHQMGHRLPYLIPPSNSLQAMSSLSHGNHYQWLSGVVMFVLLHKNIYTLPKDLMMTSLIPLSPIVSYCNVTSLQSEENLERPREVTSQIAWAAGSESLLFLDLMPFLLFMLLFMCVRLSFQGNRVSKVVFPQKSKIPVQNGKQRNIPSAGPGIPEWLCLGVRSTTGMSSTQYGSLTGFSETISPFPVRLPTPAWLTSYSIT